MSARAKRSSCGWKARRGSCRRGSSARRRPPRPAPRAPRPRRGRPARPPEDPVEVHHRHAGALAERGGPACSCRFHRSRGRPPAPRPPIVRDPPGTAPGAPGRFRPAQTPGFRLPRRDGACDGDAMNRHLLTAAVAALALAPAVATAPAAAATPAPPASPLRLPGPDRPVRRRRPLRLGRRPRAPRPRDRPVPATLPIRVWYPARPRGDEVPAPYFSPAVQAWAEARLGLPGAVRHRHPRPRRRTGAAARARRPPGAARAAARSPRSRPGR